MKSRNITAVISAKIHFLWKQVIVNERIVQRNGCCEWRRSFIISRVTNYLISTSSLRTRDLIVKKKEIYENCELFETRKSHSSKTDLVLLRGPRSLPFFNFMTKAALFKCCEPKQKHGKRARCEERIMKISSKNWLSWRNKKAFWQEFLLLTNNIYVFHVKNIALKFVVLVIHIHVIFSGKKGNFFYTKYILFSYS